MVNHFSFIGAQESNQTTVDCWFLCHVRCASKTKLMCNKLSSLDSSSALLHCEDALALFERRPCAVSMTITCSRGLISAANGGKLEVASKLLLLLESKVRA